MANISNRLPVVGELIFWWHTPSSFTNNISSGVVLEVSPPNNKILAYATVKVRVGNDSSTWLHGANPAILNDCDSWFFTLEECKNYVDSAIQDRNSKLSEYYKNK